MMVGMAGLQVFIVRFFFQGARKGEFGQYPMKKRLLGFRSNEHSADWFHLGYV